MSPGKRRSLRARRWGVTASAVCAGLAVTTLVWSVGLALWSWLATAPSPALGSWHRFHYSPWGTDSLGADTPKTIALTLSWLAAILLASVAATWLIRRRGVLAWIPAAVLAVVALGVMYIKSTGLSDFVTWMQAQPRTAQLPATLAAWRLAEVSIVALLIGCPAVVHLSRRWWRSRAVIGVVIGLVLAASTTGAAWYAGRDARFVDASSTSAPVPELPTPRTLGTKHFTVQIASASEHNAWYVEPIVGGFVTLGDGRVTAFDGKGNERWHYRRSGPAASQVTSLHVFDDGRTLVIGVGPGPAVLIGLDAGSGTQLWWSSDPALLRTQQPTARRATSPRPYLLDYDAKTHSWSRFDTRTGALMWSKPAPDPQCTKRFDAVDAPAQSLSWCGSGLTFTTIDPLTGETAWSITIPTKRPVTDAGIAHAGDGGAVLTMSLGADQVTSTHIDLATRTASPMPHATMPIDSIDRSADFLAEVDNRLSLRAADGHERCAFSDGPPLAGSDGRALVLDAEVVLAAPPGLRVFNPTTCAPLGSNTLPSIPQALVAAPGVVLVLRADASGTWLDGYA